MKTISAAGGLLLVLALTAMDAESSETAVKLSELPVAVQKAVHAKVDNGQLGEILRVSEDGEISYDVEMTREGRTRSFTIDSAGNVVEEQVFLPETPASVQKAVHAHLGKGKLDEITKVTDAGEVTYEVEITRQGKTRDFTLGETGQLLEIEMFIDELSAQLQDAIKKATGAGTVGAIYKTIEEKEVFYDVEITGAGSTRTLTFDANAKLIAEEEPVTLSDTPPPVQKALGAELTGGGKLLSLDKTTEDGEVTYDAELLRTGKPHSLALGADGKILP